jgi:hypothetical protein
LTGVFKYDIYEFNRVLIGHDNLYDIYLQLYMHRDNCPSTGEINVK